MILAAAMLTAILFPQAPTATATCLHDSATEGAEQVQRRRAAVGAARAINTLEANYAAAHQGQYARASDLEPLALAMARGAQIAFSLRPGTDVVPGFQLTLDLTAKGYWFEIRDAMDPCGFRYISNQDGLIFSAQPLR